MILQRYVLTCQVIFLYPMMLLILFLALHPNFHHILMIYAVPTQLLRVHLPQW